MFRAAPLLGYYVERFLGFSAGHTAGWSMIIMVLLVLLRLSVLRLPLKLSFSLAFSVAPATWATRALANRRPAANVHAQSEDEDKPETQLSIPLTEIPEAEAPDILIILKTDSARGI